MITFTGSSAFNGAVYFEKTKKLIVEYSTGTVYQYSDIEFSEVAKLASDSKGSELHKIIQGKTVTLL